MDHACAGPAGNAPCGGAACTLRIQQLSRALEATRRQLDETQQQLCAAVYKGESAAAKIATKRERSSSPPPKKAAAKRQKAGKDKVPSRWEVIVGIIPSGVSKKQVSPTRPREQER
jgi:hypothetical protein